MEAGLIAKAPSLAGPFFTIARLDTLVVCFITGHDTMKKSFLFAVLHLARPCFTERSILGLVAVRMKDLIHEALSASYTITCKSIGITRAFCAFFETEKPSLPDLTRCTLVPSFFFTTPKGSVVFLETILFTGLLRERMNRRDHKYRKKQKYARKSFHAELQ